MRRLPANSNQERFFHAISRPATAYNDFAEFSLKSNPNGVWSYLVSGVLLSTPMYKCGSPPQKSFPCWWNAQADVVLQ